MSFRSYLEKELNEALNAKAVAEFLDGQPIEWDDYGKRGDMESALVAWTEAKQDWDIDEVADDMGVSARELSKYLDYIIDNADKVAKAMS